MSSISDEGVPAWHQRRSDPLTFSRLQTEHHHWQVKNFGAGNDPLKVAFSFIGVVEEVGELAHSLLKQHQGIRGTFDEHEAKGKDAVGDTLVFLAAVCNRKGWDLQEIIETTWAEVSARDWTQNKDDGVAA